MLIKVMLEVIEELLSSIILRNLLYLKRAPNLFNSLESEYFMTLSVTMVFTKSELGAKFVL